MQPLRRTPHLRKISREATTSFVVRDFTKPFHPFLWHYHPEIEICCAVRGGGIRFVGDSIEPFQSGDVFIAGANLPHTLFSEPRKSQRAKWIVLQFLPDCLGPGFLSAPEARSIRALLQRAARGLVAKGSTRRTILAQIEKLQREPDTSPKRLLGFIQILVALAECRELTPLSTSAGSASLSSASNVKINRVLASFGANPEDWPGQREAAKLAHMTPPAFSRFFKRCMHKTYVRYVNELRIGTACRLLLEGDVSITEAAYRAGFNNLSNFHEQFRAIKGIAPLEYRRKAPI